MMDKRTRPEHEIVDGQIVAEFEDQTLMNLPSIEQAEASASPSSSAPQMADTGRRQFITRLVVGGVAALALGGSAALLTSRKRDPQVVVVPNGTQIDQNGVTDVAALYTRISDLEYQLAAVTAERDQLITDLDSGGNAYQTLQARIQELEAENADLREINGLWLAMDEIGLDSLIRSAFTLVGNALAALLGIIALLQKGVEKGQKVIADFVNLLLGPKAGIKWLQGRVIRLSADLDWLADQVEEVVEATEPLASKIAEFVLWILDRLPFGAGDRARAGLDAMQTVITGLPELIAGVNDDVLKPLATWLGDDNKTNLSGILLNPITDNLVRPALETLSEMASFQTTYNDRLIAPVTTSLDNRAAIRQQIQSAEARLRALRV